MTWLRRLRLPAAALAVAAAIAWPPLRALAETGAFIPAGGSAAPAAASAPSEAPAPVAGASPTTTVAPTAAPALSLQQALGLAERNSLQLKLAEVQVDRAQLGYEHMLDVTRQGGSSVIQALQQRYNYLSMWPVIPDERGADTLRHTAEMSLEQARFGREQARQAVRLAVTRAYLEWQKATALAQAQADALARAKALADSARAGVQAGTASHYDELAASAQVSAQESALTAAESARESARLALERLVGSPLDPQARPGSDLPGVEAAADLPPADSLMDTALQKRPDVAIARLNADIKQADLDLLSHDFDRGTYLLGMAELAAREASLQAESTEADARLQVRQALLAAAGARDRLKALTEAEAQAAEALRLAQLRFNAGLATSAEVLGAQSALSQAEASRIPAAADLAGALAEIQRATGEL